MSEIKLASFNCRGLGDFRKRKDVFAYLRSKDFNICLLQDVHCRKMGVPYFRNSWGTDVLVAPYTNNARGVAILSKNIQISFTDTIIDDDGNFIITKATVQNTTEFCIVNIYGPNSDKPGFYEKIFEKLRQLIGEDDMPIIAAGDFNLTLSQDMDNCNYTRENNTRARDAVKNIMTDYSLIDIYRERNPELRRYTWRVRNPVVKQARLDMFLISASLEGYVKETAIQPGYRSDHSIITLTLDFERQPRGRGLFKFNASLLKDRKYISLVKNTIISTVREYAIPLYREEYILKNPTYVEMTISASLFYEILMLTIRRETISFGIRKKKEERKVETQLEKIISEMENTISDKGTEVIYQELQSKKKELEQIRETRLEGSVVRSRALWRRGSEKPSKYFLALEKRRYESKQIPQIQTAEGIKRNQSDILKTFQEFFRKRFREQNNSGVERESYNYLSEMALKCVTDLDREKLQKQITLSELGAALSRMKNGTSPGSDGFSVDFFKFFWNDLKVFFLKMCTESLASETLPQSLKEGIIVLIPKPNKPRDLIKSYRPITLLNVSYKIISATIANRMKPVLQDIVDPCQSAYLKGRFIGDNVRLIYDIIQFMKQERTSGILLGLDIEAAFDSVSWSFVRDVMEVRNFPQNVIEWFNTLYLGSSSRILYNGHLSDRINLGRSCRQGDALSCYLFILVMDVLALRIQSNKSITGIKIGDAEYKVSMYADDTVCLIEPKKQSLQELFQEIGWFAKFSGLSPNLDKTRAMWIGVHDAYDRDRYSFQSQVGLQWCEEMKILGITFDNGLHKLADAYIDKMREIKREIAKWRFRNITLQGKVVIIKSLLISKICYLFMSIPYPSQEIIDDLTKALFRFLWHGKGEKVKRSSLMKDPLNGGVGMIDVVSYMKALKITWISRYIKKEGVWKAVVSKVLGGKAEFWQKGQTALRRQAVGMKNEFWKEVLLALADLRGAYELNVDEMSASPIFYSEITKFKSTYIGEWYGKGLRTLNDLLNSDGSLMNLAELKQLYGIQATFLDYMTLINSLPAKWMEARERRKLNGPTMDPVITFVGSKSGASHVGKVLVGNKTRRSENIWEKAWESRLTDINWKMVYQGLKNTPVQYRSTRYKVITRTVATKSLLEKMKITNTSMCDKCTQRENIEHKFWHCHRIQKFWREVKEWLIKEKLARLADGITIKNTILEGTECLILNHIVSIGVQMIHSNKQLSVKLLLAILRSDCKSEKYNANLNGKKEEFDKKWLDLNHLQEDERPIEKW